MTAVRYADVILVIASAPFVVLAGMPVDGYLIGAGVWILTRFLTDVAYRRALGMADHKARAGLQVGAMLGRVWIVALGVIAAKFIGGTSAGIMAAVVVLAAFTVQLIISLTMGAAPPGSRTAS
jgi:hypothetical protein